MVFGYKIVNRKKLAAVILVDILGLLLVKPLSFLRKKRSIERSRINKILVVRTAYVGDVVMTTPVLRPLRDMFPEAKIFFLTGRKEGEILENNPFIDEILIFNAFWFYPTRIRRGVSEYIKIIKRLRKERFDLAIDFRADIRDILFILFLSGACHRVSYRVGGGGYLLTNVVPFKRIRHKISYHLDILESLTRPTASLLHPVRNDTSFIKPEIYLSCSEEEFKTEVFRSNGISESDLVIGIHPGGRKKLKCWYAEGYIEIITRLIKDLSAKIVITGASGEVDIAVKISSAVPKGAISEKTISLCGKTTLRQLASLMKGFRLFICGDCAPMHIACTLGAPVVAIFGPSKSLETGPYGDNYRLVEKDFPCRFSCDEDVCRHGVYHGCMKAITPEDVYKAAVGLIGYGSRRL